jgi:dihydrofolate reductase
VEELRRLKQGGGEDMTILGSGTIVSQLTQAGLIDEYQFVVNPVVLGDGKTLFDGLKDKVDLKLAKSRSFKNGKVLLFYTR